MIANPALSVSKTASPQAYQAKGDVIGYSYVVRNEGNVTLSGPLTVSDNKIVAPNTVSCPATASLAPGEFITCTAQYVITQADVDAGSVTNTATATGKFGETAITSPPEPETVNAVTAPALSVSKTASPQAYQAKGDVIGYSYVVRNEGNVTLSGPLTVSDNKIVAPNTVSCPATASLAPGEFITCTAQYVITQADVDAGSVTNTATATGKFGETAITSPPEPETVNAVTGPALSVSKTASPQTYQAKGEVIGYSYVVRNEGNVTLSGPLTVSDNKIVAPNTVSCPATASLAPGEFITCTAQYVITQADVDAGSVTNTATATGKFGETAITSPPEQETVNAVTGPALSMSKTASPQTYKAKGEVIGYSYVVRNEGNVTLSGPLTVSDNKIVAPNTVSCPATASLAPGAFITCTAQYVITQADVDAGSVTNTATATGKFGETAITSPPEQETVNAVTGPALSMSKTASPQTYKAKGEVIGYSYVVRNEGNVTLSGPLTVSDNKIVAPNTVSCPATASLAPGAFITCTAQYVITQADVDAGSVTNTATATGKFGETAITSPPEQETVNAVTGPPALILDKAAPTGERTVGATLTYTVTATNTGNTTQTDVVVSDPKLTPNTKTCATLAPQATCVLTGTYVVTQADADAGRIVNSATVQSKEVPTPVTDSETTPITAKPALSLDKAAPTGEKTVGATLTYTVTATNTGNTTQTDVVVSDPKLTPNTKTCATLAPQATCVLTGTYVVTQADADAGRIVNSATVQSKEVPTPVTDSETTPITAKPALSLDKAAPTGERTVGATLTYTVTATNTGNITQTDVVVSDPKLTPASKTCPTLAPQATCVLTGTYVVTQADADAGRIVNSATVQSKEVPTPVTDSETTPITAKPALSLDKAAPTGERTVGATLTYTVTATNTGNTTQTDVVVSDPKLTPASKTCPRWRRRPPACSRAPMW